MLKKVEMMHKIAISLVLLRFMLNCPLVYLDVLWTEVQDSEASRKDRS